MEKIILFGAGVYAKKYNALLEYLHMDFDYFTDNDSSKWGTVLYGKPVISPDELTGFLPCKIIISSTHEIAIRNQLSEMGLSDKIIGLNDLYLMCEQRMNQEINGSGIVHADNTIIVDMYEGIGWGGTELWAANLALGLQKKGRNIILLGGMEQPHLEEKYEKRINLGIRFDSEEIASLLINATADLKTHVPSRLSLCFYGSGYRKKKISRFG